MDVNIKIGRFGFTAGVILVSLISVMTFCNGIHVKSLLLDEALFARNIALFPQGMFISSAAPAAPLFYLGTWALVQLFGDFEWVYKLLPVISAVLGMYVLYRYLISRFSKVVIFVSYSLFVFSVTFIHYASNAHPFVTDLFFCVLLFVLSESLLNNYNLKSWIIWVLVSAFAMMMTFPAFFYVPAWGLVILIYHWRTLQKKINYPLVLGFIPLLIIMLALYWFFYKKMAASHVDMFDYALVNKFTDSYNPVKLFKHFFDNTQFMLGYFFWNYQSGMIGLFLTFIGIIYFINKKQYAIPWLMVLIALITMIANLMHRWPVGPTRTMLFVMPLFIILFAGAFEWLLTMNHSKTSRFILIIAFFSLLIPEAWIIKNAFVKVEDSKEAVRSLRGAIENDIRDSDVFIVSYAAVPQFRYYFKDYWNNASLHSWDIRDNNELIEKEIIQVMQGNPGRYWLFFSHQKAEEEAFMIQVANQYGKQLRNVVFPGCRAVLFKVEEEK